MGNQNLLLLDIATNLRDLLQETKHILMYVTDAFLKWGVTTKRQQNIL